MLVVRLAWRNIWRNTRRTGIVITAVAVGIAGVLVSMALNYGLVYTMLDTAISTDLGHVQIHARGYVDSPELSRMLPNDGRAALRAVEDEPRVAGWAPRLRSEGLVSSPYASVGARLVAIDPRREASVTLVADSMVEGEYFADEPRRVVIGQAMAKRLKVGVGDKIVISAQDLEGDLAGEAMRVGGLFRTASRELDRGTIFMRLEEAQAMLGVGVGLSEIVIDAGSRVEAEHLGDALAAALPTLDVQRWDELQPMLVYMLDATEQSAVFVYLAIFIAMAFGIANVLLMTVFERVREIGILMAIGLSRSRLVAMVVCESVFVTLVGLLVGYALAVAGWYWLRDGIDLGGFAEGLNAYGMASTIVPVLRIEDFTVPTAVAILTALLASAWPASRAVRLKPAEAVRHR
jgi:ABC-type lipoprotein release transport system permease subunit